MSVRHFVPTFRARMVERTRILSADADHPPAATVFVGPAGTGKTVAMAQLVQSLAADAVWIALRPEDSTRLAFWRRVVAAVAASGTGGSVIDDLDRGGVFENGLQDLLVEGFAQLRSPLVLALDDLHATDERVDDDLLDLLRRTPLLSIAATSRTRRTLTTVRAATREAVRVVSAEDLALDDTEIQSLATLYLGDAATSALARRMQSATQGWAVAVHAFAIEMADDVESLREIDRRSTFIHEHVSFELSRLDDRRRRALLLFSLVDELTLGLAARLTGWSTDDARRVLETFELDGIVSRTERRGSPVFQLHSLTRSRLADLCRAEVPDHELALALALIIDEYRVSRPAIAAAAAIEARAWIRLEEILIATLATLVDVPLGAPLRELVPRAGREARPVVDALTTMSEYREPDGGSPELTRRLQESAARIARDRSRRAPVGAIATSVVAAIVHRTLGDDVGAARAAGRASARLAGVDDELAREQADPLAFCYSHVAATYLQTGAAQRAKVALASARRHARRFAVYDEDAHAVALSAMAAAHAGDMPSAERWCREFDDLPLPLGRHDAYIGAGNRVARVYTALERGDLAGARGEWDALAPQLEILDSWPLGIVAGAWLTLVEAGPAAALDAMNEALAAQAHRPPTTAYLRGQLHEMEARLAALAGASAAHPPTTPLGEARAALARGQLAYAITRARRAAATPAPRVRAEALLLQAAAAAEAGRSDEALSATRRAQRIMDASATRLPWHALPPHAARELLEATGIAPARIGIREQHDDPIGLVALTPGETRVLAVLFEERHVARTAERLFVSPNTVKTHLKRVYGKLGVRTRDEALARAAALGILDSTPGE